MRIIVEITPRTEEDPFRWKRIYCDADEYSSSAPGAFCVSDQECNDLANDAVRERRETRAFLGAKQGRMERLHIAEVLRRRIEHEFTLLRSLHKQQAELRGTPTSDLRFYGARYPDDGPRATEFPLLDAWIAEARRLHEIVACERRQLVRGISVLRSEVEHARLLREAELARERENEARRLRDEGIDRWNASMKKAVRPYRMRELCKELHEMEPFLERAHRISSDGDRDRSQFNGVLRFIGLLQEAEEFCRDADGTLELGRALARAKEHYNAYQGRMLEIEEARKLAQAEYIRRERDREARRLRALARVPKRYEHDHLPPRAFEEEEAFELSFIRREEREFISRARSAH